jgi:hypothetical protein
LGAAVLEMIDILSQMEESVEDEKEDRNKPLPSQ